MRRGERAHRRRLFLRRQIADRAVDHLPPRRAFRRRRAAVVEAQRRRSLRSPARDGRARGCRPSDRRRSATPARRRRRRSPDTASPDRRSRGLIIEPSSTTPPPTSTVKNSVGGVSSGAAFAASARVVGQRAHDAVIRQADEIDARRHVGARKRVERPASVRRNPIGVRAARAGRRHALDAAAAVEPRAIEEPLGRRARRCDQIRPAAGDVDRRDVDDVGLERRQQLIAGSVERDAVEMAPAVLLARPGDRASRRRASTRSSTVSTQACCCSRCARRDVAAARVGDQQIVGVLQPVQLLDQQRARVVGPLQRRQIGVARIAGRLHPADRAAGGVDDADAHRGIGGAGLRIRDPRDRRIEACRCR